MRGSRPGSSGPGVSSRHDPIPGDPEAVKDDEVLVAHPWSSIVDLNLTGVFLSMRAVLPHMIRNRYGRIVSVSSDAALSSRHISNAAYAASKAGILALSRHLALEVGSYNITVNATAPGVTLSSRIRNLYNDDMLAEFAAKNPLGRVGELEDQVLPILFLASDAAKHITGEVLKVSGGY